MTGDRSTKILVAVVFLVVAGFLGINNTLHNAPLGDWWLVIVLVILAVAFVAWPEPKESIDSGKPLASPDYPTEELPRPPDSLREVGDQVAKSPSTAITEAPPHEIMEPPEVEKAIMEVPSAEPKPEPTPEPEPTPTPEPTPQPKPEPEPEPEPETKAEAPAAPAEPVAPAAKPDDLSRVEGIGPKYQEALVAAGIDTFEKLANLTQDKLETTIKAAGMRKAASMATWIEQAKLAAKGDWDALDQLQDDLTGGRRA